MKNLFKPSAIKDISVVSNKKEQKSILKYFNSTIPNKDWFIAGSCAIPHLEYNDIDVFFTNEKAYFEAVEAFNRTNSISTSKSRHAVSLLSSQILASQKPIQLIRCSFGTPFEAFKKFDINICKQAILPDGKHVMCDTAKKPLHIVNPNHLTFSRYIKYLDKLKHSNYNLDVNSSFKRVVDEFISDDRLVLDFYKDTMLEDPVNYLMYSHFSKVLPYKNLTIPGLNNSAANSYLQKAAEIHAPELLI